jgi:hypothetical protein
MPKTAQQAIQAWQAAMASPQTQSNYVAGINAVTSSPMAAAAQQSAKYLAGIQQAVSSGKWQQALENASFPQWKQNATQTGAQRLASGATKALPKYTAFAQKYSPVWAQMRAASAAVQGSGMGAATAKWQAAMQVLMSAAGKG